MSQEKIVMDPLAGRPEAQQLEDARMAAREFASFSNEEVWKIADAVSAAAYEKAEYYAEWAVRETGFGVAAHKKIKNEAAGAGVAAFYRGQDFTGYQVDAENKLVKIARPAGVVLGLSPSTNPVATVIFKAMLCILSRNALVVCPHPASKECCVDAVDFLAAAAEKAGAPKGSIQVVREPTLPLVGAMMKSDKINVILATGGPGVVRAAYSSGNPAIGVGSANVPDYVDASADIQKAAADMVLSGSFDNNLPCTCVSVVLAERVIADQLQQAMVASGTHMVTAVEEVEKLRSFLYPEGAYNAAAVGKSAAWIAEQVGIDLPVGAVLMCVEIKKIDAGDLFSKEKFFPIIGFMRVDGLEQALDAARTMIEIGGSGHSVSIHSRNTEAILAMSSLDVYRVAVNGPSVLVSAGLGSALAPTFTLGTGYFGRGSVAENIGPGHLIHWTSIAYNSDPAEVMEGMEGAMKRWDDQRIQGQCC